MSIVAPTALLQCYSGERCKGVALQEAMARSGSLAKFAAIRKLCPPLLRPTMQHYAQLLRAAVTASLMLAAIAGASVAGPLEDGEAAFKRGDYATALRLWRPLANQGDARAQYYLGAIYANGQ